MSKTKISEFSTTPGNNTDINGINIAEGCAPSGINNAIRELMSDLKEWQSGAMDVYVIPQGTAAAPGIQLYGDLDTGLYGFAANQLGVAVGGASAGYFSSDGWVGNVVATTVDLTNIEVTNIKAKDGTSSIALADSTGVATFSKPTVMSVDSASDALRITQIGAGNALLVEDSANPDTSPFVVTAAGLVGVGTLNPTRTIHVSAASGLPGITLESTSNGSSSSGVVVFNRTTTSTLTSQTIGSALWSHNLTDSTLVTAASIIVTGNNTAGSNTANMAIDAKTSTIMKVNGTEVANFASGGLNVTGTVDVTSIETTNIKAKDGTAAASIADSTGAITVTKDLTANGVTLGKGLGSVLTNTALGRSALAANTVGDLNTAVGNLSLTSNIGGTGNTAVGHVAMTSHQGGSLNTAVGAGSLTANLNGNNNTAIGQSALGTATGSNNTAVGSGAGSLITNGNKNTIIGNYTGNQGGLDIRTASNYIVLSDGDGNPRAYWNGADATFGGTLTATTITGTQVNGDNLRLDGNTLSSTDANGNIIIAPDGIGQVHISNTAAVGLYQEIASNSRTPGISSLQVGQGASGEAYVVNRANSYLVLGANGSERARISANGAFRIKGNGTAGTSDAVVINQSAPTDSFVVDASGRVGIGTSTLINTLTVQAAGASQSLVSTTGTNAASSSFSNTGGTVSVGINSSAATPAYAAYISHSGTYPISFYTDSVERARINSDGILSGWSGTNSAPTFSYTNDPNTGMYFPAADKLGFTAGGGSDQMVLTTTGLGIGTSSPTNALSVTGNANITGNTTLGDASTDTVQVNGYMGVGGAANTARAVDVSSSALSGTTQDGVFSRVTGTSGATGLIRGFAAQPGTAAAAFTVSDVVGFVAINPLKGAGSIITNAHGVFIGDHSQGTNNYGITSTVSSGANKWNIYVSGTAANYFAGQVLVGTTSAIGTAQVQSAGSSVDPFEGYRFSNNANGPALSLYKNRGATVGANAIVSSGDELGTIAFRGYDGAAYRAGAFITGSVDGTPGSSDMPGRLVFSTTADGSATPTERMRIDSSGALIAKPAAGTGAVFNEDGVDADFRVESDTDTHCLFVDASANRVGIGTASPSTNLTIGNGGGGNNLGVMLSLGVRANFYEAYDGTKTFIAGVDNANDYIKIGSFSNHPVGFVTNNGEKARITAGGYFKASNDGTYFNSTGTYHELRQTANAQVVTVSATNASFTSESIFSTATKTAGTDWMHFYGTSDGNTVANIKIFGNGNVQNANNSYAGISDQKLKQDIVDAGSQWDDIKNLQVRKYRFKASPNAPLQIGLVAQEAETVSPGLVEETVDRDSEGNDLGTTTKAVKYSVLYMKAIKALQEAMARIEKLEAEVAALKGV